MSGLIKLILSKFLLDPKSAKGAEGAKSAEDGAVPGKIEALGQKSLILPESRPLADPIADAIASIAEEEYRDGAQENPPGSNRGPAIDRYLMGQAPVGTSLNWCAAFASYCVITAAQKLKRAGYDFVLNERIGAKRLRKELLRRGATSHLLPMRGDLAFYHRGRTSSGAWSWTGHVRVVTFVSHGKAEGGPLNFTYVGGNERGRVRQLSDTLKNPKLIGFVRVH